MIKPEFKISTADFQSSYFGIGVGFDINPLLLFSDHVNLFLYLNLGLNKQEVEAWYENAFLENGISVIDKVVLEDFDELRNYEMPDRYYQMVQNFVNFIGPREYQDYLTAFTPFQKWKQFAIIWSLKLKSSKKEIQLAFLTAEGLASYLALSHNGFYAPTILSTIQTQVLELPDSSFSNWLAQAKSRPKIWVKGFESEEEGVENSVMTCEPFTEKVSLIPEDYKYLCGESYPGMNSEKRKVAAFKVPEF